MELPGQFRQQVTVSTLVERIVATPYYAAAHAQGSRSRATHVLIMSLNVLDGGYYKHHRKIFGRFNVHDVSCRSCLHPAAVVFSLT